MFKRYIRDTLTDDIVDEGQPRVVKCMMMRAVLYMKDGDNSVVVKNTEIVGITLDLTSPVGAKWDQSVMAEIQHARSAGVSIGGGSHNNDGGENSISVKYFSALAAWFSGETDVAVDNAAPEPQYNGVLVR